MAARLFLACHAETDATRRAAFAVGEGLTARGLDAAGLRAASLPPIDVALASPAPAARETAGAFGLTAAADEGLRDLDAGRWRGRTLAAVAATEPDGVRAWLSDPRFDAHGGESIAALIARTAAWLRERREGAGVAFAVTHASVARAAVVAVLEASPSAFWSIEAPPLATVELGSDGRRWSLRALTR